MNRFRFGAALLLSLGITVGVNAQTHEPCGTMHNHRWHMEENAHLETSRAEAVNQINGWLDANPDNAPRAGVKVIPVVFHIIHDGDPVGVSENISDSQVMSQLDALNRDFNRLNPDSVNTPSVFQSIAANTEIEFCLARFNEFGIPTYGIQRHDLGKVDWYRQDPGSSPAPAGQDIETDLKPSTIWDRDKYLNIWVCRFGGDLVSRGVQGYSQFPGMGATTDGVILRYTKCGQEGEAAGDLGRTCVHEVGHWLDLRHVWGDDQDDPDPCTGTDLIDDTPNQRVQYFNCPVWPQSSCGSQDMYMNYMDYTDDNCSNLFTNDQSARMHSTLETVRAGVPANSGACDYYLDLGIKEVFSPTSTMCNTTFTPIVEVANDAQNAILYFELLYSLDGGSVQKLKWTGNLLPGQTEIVNLGPITTTIGAHNLTIIAQNPNGIGGDDYLANDTRNISFSIASDNGAGAALPLTEDFESGGIPVSWTVDNPDSDRTWTSASVSANGVGSGSAVMDNQNTSTNPTGTRDAIVTVDYDFTDRHYAELTFDVAYARKSATEFDSLIIYYSVNCGSDWHRLWAKGGSDLATSADLSAPFTPLASNWRNETVYIERVANSPAVSFKFENYSGWGNNLYLDNINIDFAPVGIEEVAEEKSVSVYPNPASETVTLEFTDGFIPEAVTVTDLLGKNVISNAQPGNDIATLDVRNWSAGTYIVRLVYADGSHHTQKLIVNH